MRIKWDQHNCISSTEMYCMVSLLTPNTKPPLLSETGKSSTVEATDSVYQQYYPRRALPIVSHVGKNRITELPAFCKQKYGVVFCSTPYMELIRGVETWEYIPRNVDTRPQTCTSARTEAGHSLSSLW